MKVLKTNLILPPNNEHTCPHCGIHAIGLEDLTSIFGFRQMGDVNKTIRVQSWCRRCRSTCGRL